ncbi:hypothetical protein L6259_00455 [Candidatus Parcubacteria bacterium]|nr:hypothetical protein [Patescibacteria group bacterium]MCG2693745.1 hypothetical protein [Candidatus Parcubacteria bacterium]
MAKVAIILNKNARSVTESVTRTLEQAITDEKLFISENKKDARKICEEIVRGGFDAVMCGGGDGTFAQVITDVISFASGALPAFGILRLGTGNGVAEAVRAAPFNSKNIAAELKQARDDKARIKMQILKIGERYAPFASTGIDSRVLKNYNIVRKILNAFPFFPKKNRGMIDYALGTTLTIWGYILKEMPQIIIRNGRGKAYRIEYHGKRISEAYKPGEVLYRGSVLFAGVSTVRYYGFDVPIFPQVHTLFGDYFQLRVTSMPILTETIPKLKDILLGTLSSEKLWDYACKDVVIEPVGKQPFQIGGDYVGRLKEMRVNCISIQAILGSAAAAGEPPT